MLQAFYGVLMLGLLSNALNMAGVSSFLQVLTPPTRVPATPLGGKAPGVVCSSRNLI